LSSGNPLLWMGRSKADIHVDLHLICQETGLSFEDLVNSVLSGKKKIRIAAAFDPRNPSENRIGSKLNKLSRSRILENQERGTDNLFLAWPFILGQWPDGTWVRTPFQFIPFSLESDGKFWWIEPKIDSAILNPAFMLAYSHHTGKSLDDTLFEKELGIEAENAIEYLTKLYEILKESSIDINFNSELFSLSLQEFKFLKKQELPSGFGNGVLRLQQEAMIGLFSLSDSMLLPDFEVLEQSGTDLDSIFLSGQKLEKLAVSEKEMLFPLAIDGSQEACLREILSGSSLLVQGPPGTGKSQLISNLVAACTANGKSVLVVCQKKVALEVVHKRLAAIGIETHAALWADYRNDLAGLYASISKHIEGLEETESRNKGLDTVLLERDFLKNCQEITSISERFEEWKLAVFDESLCGISAHSLDQKLQQLEKVDCASIGFLNFSCFQLSEWASFSAWYERFSAVFFSGRHPGHLMARRGMWGSSVNSNLLALEEILKRHSSILAFLNKQGWVESTLEQYFPTVLGQNSIEFPEVEERLANCAVEEVLSDEFIRKLSSSAKRLEILLIELESWPNSLFASYSDIVELNQIHEIHSGKSISILKIQALFSKTAAGYLGKYKQLKRAGFARPEDALNSAIEFHQISASNQIFNGLGFFGAEGLEVKALIEKVSVIIENLEKQSKYFRFLKKVLPDARIENLEDLGVIAEKIANAFSEHDSDMRQLKGFFSFADSDDSILVLLKSEFDNLKLSENQMAASDKLLTNLEIHWQKSLLELASLNNKVLSEQQVEKLWCLGWKDRIREKYPILDYKSEWFQQDGQILTDLIRKKRVLSAQMLRLKLEEASHKDVLRNRLQNRVTYRGLYHQVTKKRRRLPLRSLWQLYGDEILKFIPCWLATPESVSATWPMEKTFDMVIFDEASQCFAEKGIPSVYRGRQVVVIGDSKQLPPNQLFSTRWEEEEEDPEQFFTGQDSLLDLAKQFYPSRMLTGHYRSVYPELMEFSNKHFYEGRLRVIPAPGALLPRKPALQFIKLDGKWDNQMNQAEAEWIVENAIQFFKENTGETLGVITFNLRQQNLIEELLLSKSLVESVLVPHWFFVKNIENVQGDERDFIWFSVAYGKNEQGRRISQFGSLGQEGGENRLNVAISRAKKGVSLVTSLFPQEWDLSENAKAGPRLLAAYSAFVFASSQEVEIVPEQALGSLLNICDKVENQGSEPALVFNQTKRVFGIPSMKEHFGLAPEYYSSIGFSSKFNYWRLS